MSDLNEVITESIEDVELPPDTLEATPEATETPAEPVEATPEATTPQAEGEPTPTPKPPVDDFEKKFGIPAQSLSGRENRIPYSRVKKITEKAVNDRVKELEATYTPQLQEYETKLRDYETRLEQVGQFENIMINRPDQFLDMLSTVPAYRPFFRAIEAALTNPQSQTAPVDDMPQPNQDLPDGTKVYDMEGLKALLAWQANKTEARVTKQIEERYKPIESEWEAQQRIAEILPKVRADIAEARTWVKFNENEDDIVAALQSNPKLSLEGAYRQIVFPKVAADRDKMRQELLKEIKQAPQSTSATSGASKASAQSATSGPRNLEDVIAEAVKTLK